MTLLSFPLCTARLYDIKSRFFFFFFLVWKRFDSGRFAVCVLCGWRIPICGFRSITVWNRRRSCQNGDVCDAQRTMIIREWEGTTLVSLVGFCRGLRRCTINSIKGETIGTTTRESKGGKKKRVEIRRRRRADARFRLHYSRERERVRRFYLSYFAPLVHRCVVLVGLHCCLVYRSPLVEMEKESGHEATIW